MPSVEQGTELVSLALCHGHPCTGTLLHKKKDQAEVISCDGQHRFLNLCVSKEVFVPISILRCKVYEKGGSE